MLRAARSDCVFSDDAISVDSHVRRQSGHRSSGAVITETLVGDPHIGQVGVGTSSWNIDLLLSIRHDTDIPASG
jgi:hypothetical protein